MGQSISQIWLHLVFSTKQRYPFLRDTQLRGEMHAYLAASSRELKCPANIIGGVADHVHILCSFSRTITVGSLLRQIKQASSKWIKTRGGMLTKFRWQEGYAAFSVSPSHLDAVYRYIADQEQHHQRVSFKDELLKSWRNTVSITTNVICGTEFALIETSRTTVWKTEFLALLQSAFLFRSVSRSCGCALLRALINASLRDAGLGGPPSGRHGQFGSRYCAGKRFAPGILTQDSSATTLSFALAVSLRPFLYLLTSFPEIGSLPKSEDQSSYLRSAPVQLQRYPTQRMADFLHQTITDNWETGLNIFRGIRD